MSIPTAEEFLKNYKNDSDHYADQDYSEDRLVKALQEFTKLHLEKCKKEISEKVKLKGWLADFACEFQESNSDGIDKDSILNAYPLENIK
jgi:hypothetical protein